MLSWFIAPLLIASAAAPTPVPHDDITLELVSDSFSAPLLVTAPAGDDRVFVVERGGKVKVVIDDQVIGTYLDVSHLLPASPGSEQGLLGLAFHPDFQSNGRVYFSYTDSGGDLVVARIVVDPNANSVSPVGRTTVIEIDQFASNHNGGMILFGPDSMLYVGTGDGGGGGDPQQNGQDKNTLLAALLRLDVNGDDFPADPIRNYSIPGTNPFVGAAGADEIWVYGLRNPWRFWIDGDTGRLYIADVGQSSREEVTVLNAGEDGANLGWNRLEGSACYPPGASCSSSGTVLPDVEYSQSGGASITGGVVYRGSQIPDLYGTYFYADFIRGWIRSFQFNGSVSNHYDWSSEWSTNLVSSFGVDGHGEMFVISLGGSVWRVKGPPLDDEIFFYRTDGNFRYYDINTDASLGGPIRAGSGYSANWLAITAVDLEGDGTDEMFFYRSNGVYAYYDMGPDASLGGPIRAGSGYSHKWDSITSVDLDGDGQDEMFFYDADSGLYAYYNIGPDAALGSPLKYEVGYSTGWDSITSADLDGDGTDEMLFYRSDGTFKYYRMRSDGSFHSLISSGSGYSTGWSSISAIDLEGDGDDELLFYRQDGTFKYYTTSPQGLGSLIRSGSGYSSGWSSVTSVNLD